MKLVLTAALCLVPALVFAGEKPTNEPTPATPAVAVDQEVVEEVADDGCKDGTCTLRTRRVWPFRVVEVFDCKDGCCTERHRVVTPRCRNACKCECECEEVEVVETCENTVTRCRPRLFGRWRTRSCSTCSTCN